MNDLLRPASMTQIGYDQVRRRTLTAGCDATPPSHHAFTTTDRTGTWFWACRNCPAVRAQGAPTWKTP